MILLGCMGKTEQFGEVKSFLGFKWPCGSKVHKWLLVTLLTRFLLFLAPGASSRGCNEIWARSGNLSKFKLKIKQFQLELFWDSEPLIILSLVSSKIGHYK